MWELYGTVMNIPDVEIIEGAGKLQLDLEFYDFYGKKIHHSRVYKINGKEAPSFIKPRLRGWGMSELERVVRSINQYMKNQDVIFDLLDEAKIDVYKHKGFNAALSNKDGTNKVTQRVQSANMIKNYQHAIVMDSEDDYQQKQITFAGLSEVLTQIRQGVAADLKMPLTKLFGISSAGFNSGEDDIENYNSMIEGEIRAKCKFIVADMVGLCCRKVFGFAPDDLIIKFHPLRILSAKEEEEVKDRQYNRTISAYTNGLMAGKEAKDALNKASLLPVEVDATKEALPPLGVDTTVNADKP
jgi:phage-related protein (TIGR01555 family)